MSKIMAQKSVFDPITFKRTGKLKGSDRNIMFQRPRRYSADSVAMNSILDKNTVLLDLEGDNSQNPEPRARREEVGLKASLLRNDGN